MTQILTLNRAAPAAPAGSRDPIADARDLLKRAARLPYHVSRADQWGRRFLELSLEARRALTAHVTRVERGDSPVMRLRSYAPHLLPAVLRQSEEHAELLRRSEALVDEARALDHPGIWTMVELGEQAMLLSQALERHQARLLELVHEADRDVGGQG